jgi:hypothetical protein
MPDFLETEPHEAYDRALRDYTQLLRHRIANPLTAISAGLSTLRDVEMSDETRAMIFDSVIEQARKLETVALQPMTISPEEAELQPMVDSLRFRRGSSSAGDDLRSADRARRAGRNEARFRTVNERIVDATGPTDGLIEIACECANLDCADGVLVTEGEYTAVHENAAQFIIAVGHEDAEVERVVGRNRDWVTVEKTGAARQEAVRVRRTEQREPSPRRRDVAA